MTSRSAEGTSLNVFYTGPGLAGVSTSLGVLAPPSASQAGACRRYDHERAERGFWFGDGDSRRFVRLVSDYRGNIYIPSLRQGAAYDTAWVRERCERALAFLPSVHGVVFVADSQALRDEANVWQLERVVADLQSVGRDAATIPFVFQLNKRDIATSGSFIRVFNDPNPGDLRSVPNEVLPVDELRRLLATPRCAYVESVASRGQGVREALDALVQLIGR